MPALPYPAVRKSVQEAHRVEFTREVKYEKTPVQGRLPRVAQVSPEMDSGGPCRESTASGFCSKWFEMVENTAGARWPCWQHVHRLSRRVQSRSEIVDPIAWICGTKFENELP